MGTEKDNREKRRSILMGTAIGVITTVNVIFGVVNIHTLISQSQQNDSIVTLESTATQSQEPATTEVNEEQDPRRSVADAYENLGIIVNVNNYLNIRKEPNSESVSIGKAMKYAGVNVVSETDDEWYFIESEGGSGYVSKKFVATGEEGLFLAMEHCKNNAEVKNATLDVYQSASVDSQVIFTANQGNAYRVETTIENWVKIQITDGLEGYVTKDQVDIAYTLERPIFFGNDGSVSELRLNIINKAWDYYGGAYVWGGTTLGEGVDCSGFMLRIFEANGIMLSRLSVDQANNGVEVSVEQMRPGDLLFFHGYHDGVRTDGVGHVAMYIGDGKMIHAASEARGIVVDNWDYIGAPLYIRNVIGD